MTIKFINRDTDCELFLDGRLDSNTTPEAEELFNQSAEKYETVVLNLEKLEYISSAGLRALKHLHIVMKKKGGQMILKDVSGMVLEVLEMTGFAGLFTFR